MFMFSLSCMFVLFDDVLGRVFVFSDVGATLYGFGVFDVCRVVFFVLLRFVLLLFVVCFLCPVLSLCSLLLALDVFVACV